MGNPRRSSEDWSLSPLAMSCRAVVSSAGPLAINQKEYCTLTNETVNIIYAAYLGGQSQCDDLICCLTQYAIVRPFILFEFILIFHMPWALPCSAPQYEDMKSRIKYLKCTVFFWVGISVGQISLMHRKTLCHSGEEKWFLPSPLETA